MKGITKHIFQSVLVLGLLLAGEGVMWGASNYYAKGTIKGNAIGGSGTVYVAKSENEGYSFSSQDFTGYISSTSSPVTVSIEAKVYLKADPDDGYHFVEWRQDSQTGTTIGDKTVGQEFTHTFSIQSSSTDEDNPATDTKNVYGIFAQNRYYAKLNMTNDGNGTASVTTSNPNYKTTPDNTLDFGITASPKSGYHFKKWTATAITDGTFSFGDDSNANTTFTAQVASDYDEDKAREYTVKATFAENYYVKVSTSPNDPYWGNAYVKYGNSFSGTKTEDTNGNGKDAADQDETFSIKAAPNAKYHFVNWTSSDVTTLPTTEEGTVTVKTKSGKQGTSNPATYNVKANFAENYFTKVTVNKNTDGGTAYVKFGNSFSGTNIEDTNGNGNAAAGREEIYSLKATEKPGFAFTGWEAVNGTLADPNNPSTTVTVTTNASYQGEGNPFTCNVTAKFKEIYSITIQANGIGKGRIVFKVTGPKNYRVSVPVGGQIVLKDVPEGDYTITPQTAWSWSYDVTPAEQHTSFSPTDNMSTNEFTVTPKSTTKKHAEVGKTVTPGA